MSSLDKMVNLVLVPRLGGSKVEWGLTWDIEGWGTPGLEPRNQVSFKLDQRLCGQPEARKCSLHMLSFKGETPLRGGSVPSSVELCFSVLFRGQLVPSPRDSRFLVCFGENLREPSPSPSLESALRSGLLSGVAGSEKKGSCHPLCECSSGPGHLGDQHSPT